jgi:UDP-3-O-[3-hydroxymyristoyl] glucosamine N-acyltransferase
MMAAAEITVPRLSIVTPLSRNDMINRAAAWIAQITKMRTTALRLCGFLIFSVKSLSGSSMAE